MGHFKSVSKKRKIQRKIIIFLLEIISALVIVKVIKKNYKLNEDKLVYLTYNYLGKISKKVEQVNNEVIENTIPIFKNERDPTVYIYNTHQSEKYKYSKVNNYNLDYTVMFGSQILKDYLNEYGINAYVEENLISKVLNENNLVYKDSYVASRILMENAKKSNPTLKYFIDLHRDSSSYERTTCLINDDSYAKVLFVLGLENPNYEKNKKMINVLNNKIISYNSCLSRGIMEKEGPYSNGVYNQDFDNNTILIEVGGQYNDIKQVDNTLKVLAKVLYEYIMEDSWQMIKKIHFLKYYLFYF